MMGVLLSEKDKKRLIKINEYYCLEDTTSAKMLSFMIEEKYFSLNLEE